MRVDQKRYRDENKDAVRAGERRWREEHAEHVRRRSQANYQRNKAARNAQSRRWAEEHPERRREIASQHHKRNAGRIRARARAWQKANKSARNKIVRRYSQKRYASDLEYRLVRLLRARLRSALQAAKGQKQQSTQDLIGCTPAALVQHIEAQFQPGMSWEQRHAFHIDHVRPCASFDLRDPAQQKLAFHYTNLRPVWAAENLQKKAYYAGRHWTHAEHARGDD